MAEEYRELLAGDPCSKHGVFRESVIQTGMLRKPPKKVVELAGYKRSHNCTGDS
jgi:hypothetical protein